VTRPSLNRCWRTVSRASLQNVMELPSVLGAEPVSLSAVFASALNRVRRRRPDYLVALGATMLIIFLHVCLTPNVGGLWRDEVNTVNLATVPTWHDVWRFHNQDSFPLLFASAVRIWSYFFGAGDDSIRLLGLVIGLSLVGAFWINARLLGLACPFWSLVLVGANPMVIRYGDSARAYGLGLVLLLFMFGFVWRITQKLDWRTWVTAMAVAVAGVHTTYYNPVLLFAICMAGCVVALAERQWRSAGAIVGVGAVAALSLLPYVGTFLHADDWNFLVRYPFSFATMWNRLSEVTGSPSSIGILIWSLLSIAAIVIVALELVRGAKNPASWERRKVVLFCGVALLLGILSYVGFLKLLSYGTNPWYYLSLIAFVAICIDPILSPKTGRLHSSLRAGAALILLAAMAIPTSRVIAARHTNLDLVAHELERVAAPEDLIVVSRWQYGVTMQRYYRGLTPWTTIPPLPDFRFQSHQPVIAQMQAEAPLQPIFEGAERALRSGHRVWVLGPLAFAGTGKAPPILPRASSRPGGWRGSEAFYYVWEMQLSYFLSEHGLRVQNVSMAEIGPVNEIEDLPVRVVRGWK
jgi:hypothetical protein